MKHVRCISGELDKPACAFAITNNGGSDFPTNASAILPAGKAPPQVKFIHVNGAATNANITWLSVTNWSLGVSLASGPNTNTVQGYDWQSNILSNAFDSIIITNSP